MASQLKNTRVGAALQFCYWELGGGSILSRILA